MSNPKRVYLFAEGNAKMRDLLGGKGANLAEMTNIGMPVPPGFIITTEASRAYLEAGEITDEIWNEAVERVRELERTTGREFGSATNPLLVSVRSGAAISMPGMMDTILNLGLNDRSVQGL